MNKFYTENDNELLHLIKLDNEDALQTMFEKYDILIKTKIKKYNFPFSLYEDYLQEGRLMLLKAIETFDAKYEKTFNKYFDLILSNHFNNLYNKAKRYQNSMILVETTSVDIEIKEEEKEEIEYPDLGMLPQIEQVIFDYFYKGNYPIREICMKFKYEEKQVYNAIQRVKTKIKKANQQTHNK